MQVYRRQDSPSLSEFKAKVRHEEAAVGHQIKKYKTHYLSKVISPCDLQPFARFTKQLGVLITSHCKNIIMIAPESLYGVFEEMNLLVDDLVNKYHNLAVKFSDNLIELNKVESKAITTSQLCFVCSQQKKKAQIQRLRGQLLNLSDFHIDKLTDLSPKNEEEDLQFFSEVNNLLTAQQGNILRNQIQINKYQDIVLNSLNALLSVQKQIQEKDNNVLPNHKWIDSAKEEMQMALKECFSDKIPPWISKMLSYFIRIHLKQVVSKQKEAEVQTDTSTHFDMLQLKKRILISKTKIQHFQTHKRVQQKELFLITTEKKALEQKIDYYKTEINKLLEQIDSLKTENQIIRIKLQNSRMKKIYEDHNNSELQIQRDGSKEESMRDTIRTNMSIRKKHKVSSSESKILPKIEELTRNTPKEGRTSIRLEQQPSVFQRSDRVKKTIKMLQESSRGSETNTLHEKPTRRQTKKQIKEPTLERKDSKESHEQLPAIQSQKESRSGRQNRDHADRATECESIIKEEDGQTNLEEEKLQMKRVDDQLREAIKKGILQKNGHKHYFSSSLPIPGLKKVPSKTVKHQYPSEIETRDSCVQTATASPSPRTDSLMGINISKIFNELTKSGYLIKISEQQFKQIIKIKTFEAQQQFLPRYQADENHLKALSRNKKQEKLAATRRQWNQCHFSHDRNMTMRPTINQQFEKDYMVLFTNERNAFNYEASLTKNHSRGVYKMSKAQSRFSEQLFQRLSEIKVTNNEHYKFICSYLRFPFQMMQNNFEVNFLNDMKYASFEYYLERIMGIHIKCKKQDGMCSHMTLFKKKLFAGHKTTEGLL